MKTVVQEIGRALCRAREARGWSQRFLAQQLLVTRETVDHMERGSRVLGPTLLEAARLLNFSLDEFNLSRPHEHSWVCLTCGVPLEEHQPHVRAG